MPWGFRLPDHRCIRIQGASEHNLRHLDLEIPVGRLTVISGVSGSGKSSLAFDTLYREAQRRFLELLPGYARAFTSGLRRPAVESITGLGPGVAVDQRVSLTNPRSTVGTLSELWDLLRVLYARVGDAPTGVQPTRGLFSFNGAGACPHCQGLGVEDALDLEALVADASKSLRQGALAVTTPFAGGYLMYSQVTLTSLDALLKAHGGNVDTPWRDLTEEVRRVVLHGSDRLTISLGKHTLETRLKWKGITARPQPEGLYRGLVPVMEEILHTKRNDGILRFARTGPCSACGGTRLRDEARAVRVAGRGIHELAHLRPSELVSWMESLQLKGAAQAVGQALVSEVRSRASLMAELGLGHLTLDCPAPGLNQGEARRLRLLSLALGELRDLLVVLDEPSGGLHSIDVPGLVRVLQGMVAKGQTVVVVDHDPMLAKAADHVIRLGPGGGSEGGRIVDAVPEPILMPPPSTKPLPLLSVGSGTIIRGGLNVITGRSGAGKRAFLQRAGIALGAIFPRILRVDAEPIGRTPRSCIATYTGAMDLLRDRYAATEEAKALGLGRGAFSFNTEGGRCEACQGAGVREFGMRHLGAVEVVCEVCEGKRFRADVLRVKVEGLNLAELLELEIGQAVSILVDNPKLTRILTSLVELGMGHLSLGHRAPDLSGGEAQRVKLATELARTESDEALLLLEEPMTGLHPVDAAVLLRALRRIREAGHTLLVVEHHLGLVRIADRVVELEAGRVVFEGTVTELAGSDTATGLALGGRIPLPCRRDATPDAASPIRLEGVSTHTLKGVDAAFPVPGLTVVTGPSGSGKSSLVFDTLLAESQARFADLVSPWARRFLPQGGGAHLEAAWDLRASLGIGTAAARRNPRSTVGTASGLDELLRLLFSREGLRPDGTSAGLPASAFSPHTHAGACSACRGLGFRVDLDANRLVTHPHLPLEAGALGGSRFGTYLGEAEGQHMATLRTAAKALGLDCSGPWDGLTPEAQNLALEGAGERVFEVKWAYRRGKREGIHTFERPWEGLRHLALQEQVRLQGDPKGDELERLLMDIPCRECQGERLAEVPRSICLGGCRLPELERLPLTALVDWVAGLGTSPTTAAARSALRTHLDALEQAGLGYVALERELSTLSGGEAQRLRLTSALRTGLTGIAYVLDEPTLGLHPADIARLIGVLRRLAEAGNAVVVVEHHPDVVRAADHVLELGPGAGPEGGQLVASGTPEELAVRSGSHTARLLAEAPLEARASRQGRSGLRILGAHRHNLQDLDVELPAGVLAVVIGPSGSGKSTLLLEVVAASLQAGRPLGCRSLEGMGAFGEVLATEQEALAISGTSTVATLMDLAGPLRRRFAASPDAKRQGLSSKAFSLTHPGGRCEACEGRGVVTVPMDLLPDVAVPCETCGGRRFRPEILAVAVEGLNLADLLDLPVREVLLRFPALQAPLQALVSLGLGYLPLGQMASTLSEGERQRLRLAWLLAEPKAQPVAVLLDEPTRGLGPGEVACLCDALGRLADQGHLVVAVTHHPDLIRAADWTVELGPVGGPGGGRLVRMG